MKTSIKSTAGKSPFTKIIITVIIALFIPVFSYTIFQYSQRNKDEEIIRASYRQQLESILFSINQHCWDVFRSWASTLTTTISAMEASGRQDYPEKLRSFIQGQKPIVGAAVRLPNSSTYFAWQARRRGAARNDAVRMDSIIAAMKPEIEKMIGRAREGYLKPVAHLWSSDQTQSTSLLLFPLMTPTVGASTPPLAALFVDDDVFVGQVVARKFAEINDGTFIFAVRERRSKSILFATEETEEQQFELTETLWLLPHLDLQIKLQGISLEQLSRQRIRTNLIFLSVVDLVLLLGVLYLLRNIKHEMALAKLKTDFVANVSHELRTPLALIRMHAETLEMGRVHSEEKKQHYYRTIMAESARLTQLITNILDFSRIESNRKEYNLSVQDLGKLVRTTLKMYLYHLQQKGFRVQVDVPDDLPPVNIDSEAIRQAFVNLLDNAVKFSPEVKSIDISLQQKDHRIILSVRDHGTGIPEGERRKIFEKFYRVGSSLVHNTKGSGLGLSLVKHIMKIHGGDVTVDSKVGEGSTFSLIFPVANSKGVV